MQSSTYWFGDECLYFNRLYMLHWLCKVFDIHLHNLPSHKPIVENVGVSSNHITSTQSALLDTIKPNKGKKRGATPSTLHCIAF